MKDIGFIRENTRLYRQVIYSEGFIACAATITTDHLNHFYQAQQEKVPFGALLGRQLMDCFVTQKF